MSIAALFYFISPKSLCASRWQDTGSRTRNRTRTIALFFPGECISTYDTPPSQLLSLFEFKSCRCSWVVNTFTFFARCPMRHLGTSRVSEICYHFLYFTKQLSESFQTHATPLLAARLSVLHNLNVHNFPRSEGWVHTVNDILYGDC
jgi:hypothetical protein